MREFLTVTAVAPGHVTGLFVPDLDSADPLARGSLGAGLVLDGGAVAKVSVRPAPRTTLTLTSRKQKVDYPVTNCAVRKLLKEDGRPWRATVDLRHDLPISGGLGMSAAGTLAASLALAHLLGISPIAGARAAHLAEMECHSGLGGVAAILGGGIEVRRRAGVPPQGSVERTPWSGQVLLAFPGVPMPSQPLLSDPRFLEKVRRAGTDLMGDLSTPPVSMESFMEASSAFTDTMGLAGPQLRAAIDLLRHEGHIVAQAMLGQTLFFPLGPEATQKLHSLETGLHRLGLKTVGVRVAPRGARVVQGPAPD